MAWEAGYPLYDYGGHVILYLVKECCQTRLFLRAVPFKSVVGGGGGGVEREVFCMGEGPNSELFYPIRLYMISGRKGVGCRMSIIFFKFDTPPPPPPPPSCTILFIEICINLQVRCCISPSTAWTTFAQSTRNFENHLIPVRLILIGHNSLNTNRWVLMCQGFSHFSVCFLHNS